MNRRGRKNVKSRVGGRETSWQKVSGWYNESMGKDGGYFHQQVIIPNLLRMLGLSSNDSLVDLGCGQGILERAISPDVRYLGIDIAGSLLAYAQKEKRSDIHQFLKADLTKNVEVGEMKFTHAASILALQNLSSIGKFFHTLSLLLANDGIAVLVINHPYFRIPKHTGWEIDQRKRVQYRRSDLYMSSVKVPIRMNPGKKESSTTWSFHYPLWMISEHVARNGLMIEKIEEWTSKKSSVGPAAQMENFSRDQFPMFMALKLRKIS